AASALILLGPGTPMLFQGEEWAASTPFTYFTAHDDELGAAVTAGRVEEFSAMGWAEQVPDPQLRSTFEASILRWQEREQAGHVEMLEWYRTLIGLRREHADLHDPSLEAISVEVLAEETVLLRRGALDVFVHRGPGRSAAGPRAAEVLASFGAVPRHPGRGPRRPLPRPTARGALRRRRRPRRCAAALPRRRSGRRDGTGRAGTSCGTRCAAARRRRDRRGHRVRRRRPGRPAPAPRGRRAGPPAPRSAARRDDGPDRASR